jgi:hypothetical protein
MHLIAVIMGASTRDERNEAAKMLLVILGCNADKEGFKGKNWSANTVAKAMELGLSL